MVYALDGELVRRDVEVSYCVMDELGRLAMRSVGVNAGVFTVAGSSSRSMVAVSVGQDFGCMLRSYNAVNSCVDAFLDEAF